MAVAACRPIITQPHTPGLLGPQRPTVTAGTATERETLTAAGRRPEATARRTRAAQRRRGATSRLTRITGRRPETTSLRRVRMVGRNREAIPPLTQTAGRRAETVFLLHARPVERRHETTSRLTRQVGDSPETVSPLILRKRETVSRLVWAGDRPEAAAPLGWEAACSHGTTSRRAWVVGRRRGTTSRPHGWVAAVAIWAAESAWAAAGEGRP